MDVSNQVKHVKIHGMMNDGLILLPSAELVFMVIFYSPKKVQDCAGTISIKVRQSTSISWGTEMFPSLLSLTTKFASSTSPKMIRHAMVIVTALTPAVVNPFWSGSPRIAEKGPPRHNLSPCRSRLSSFIVKLSCTVIASEASQN